MLQRTFFRGPVLITLDPPGVEAADILVADGQIARKGWRLHAPPDAEIVDARGRIICPGLVNARVRLDASFSRTLPMPAGNPADIERLQAVSSEETAICAAFAVGIEAVRAGCTALFNFHETGGFVRGALARIRDVMSTIGLRSTAACGVGGRIPEEALALALAESGDAATFGRDGRAAFFLGAGDLANVTDATLSELAQSARRSETPIHATVGFGPDPAGEIARLRSAGLLFRNSMLLLLKPLGATERETLAQEGVVLVHSPSAEALLSHPPRRLEAPAGTTALGTDAGRPDLFEEARSAFARARAAGEAVTPADVVAMVAQGMRVASDVFRTRFGSFEPGSAADLIVLDYRPPVPLNPATVCHHFLFGMSSAAVQHVMVDGHMIVRDRVLANVDVRNLFRQTQRGALDLWQRLQGEEFPGLRTTMKGAPTEPEPREKTVARRFDEEDVEFEPLALPPEALRPWLVCKPGADAEPSAAPPAAPRIPQPATAQSTSRKSPGFGDGIL